MLTAMGRRGEVGANREREKEGERRKGKSTKRERWHRMGIIQYLSIEDSIWTQLAVLYREVSRNSDVVHSSMWLGLQTVSSLERSPLFRGPFLERFHCTYNK